MAEELKAGDRVWLKSDHKATGTIDELWDDDGTPSAVIVWDISGCAGEGPLAELELIPIAGIRTTNEGRRSEILADGTERPITKRKGDWIQTYMGVSFWPLDPRPEEILIADIAHSLALKVRWNGHVKEFYSVAEHSVHVSHMVPRELALRALLHDASEAYIDDVPRPIKPLLVGYKEIEARLQEVIYQAFGVADASAPDPEPIKVADAQMLATEAYALMRHPERFTFTEAPTSVHLHCMSPAEAELLFLTRFAELTNAA